MSTPEFKIGDSVVAVNDYGRNNGLKTITGYELNAVRGHTYYFTPTDTPWFATSEKNLFHPTDTKGIEYAETHGEVWRRA